jgi:hypothetical protein
MFMLEIDMCRSPYQLRTSSHDGHTGRCQLPPESVITFGRNTQMTEGAQLFLSAKLSELVELVKGTVGGSASANSSEATAGRTSNNESLSKFFTSNARTYRL